MKQGVGENTSQGKNFELDRHWMKYYSVEFSMDGLECAHQFRIWNSEPASMFVLVKQNSILLRVLKVGDTVKMKYYTGDSSPQAEYMNTTISRITREDQGKFRGHCVIGLAVAGA